MLFNINEYVKIKPTAKGWKILTEKAKEVLAYLEEKRLNNSLKIMKWEDLVIKPDEYGYIHLQMWEVMQTFGEHMSESGELLFETEMQIRCKDSKPLSLDCKKLSR